MNSLVAHDQLANLNFGKLRINSKILRISFVRRNIITTATGKWIEFMVREMNAMPGNRLCHIISDGNG